MHSWDRTQSVNLAAALTTLGIPISLDKSYDAKYGTDFRWILLGREALPTHEELGGIREPDPETGDQDPGPSLLTAPSPAIKTAQMRKLIETGALQRADPAHPVLDAIGGIHNRECFLDWMNKGTRYCIARAQSGKDGLPVPRSLLIKGEETEAIKQTQQLFRTGDIKVAAALARFGVPPIRIEGVKPHHKFVFALHGHPLVDAVPPVNASDLVTAYRKDSLPADHPFRWAMQGNINREMILDLIFKKTTMILLRKPGSGAAAIVPENANDACMEKVRAFWRIV